MSEVEKKKKSCRHGRSMSVGFWSIILLIALFLFLDKAGIVSYSYWSAFMKPLPLVLFIVSIFCLFRCKWISGIFLLVAAKFFWLPYWIPLLREQCLCVGCLPEGIEDGFVRKYWYILVVFFAFLMIIKHLFCRKRVCCESHWEYEVKKSRKRPSSSTREGNGFIESNAVFNSADRVYSNENFTGGSFNIVFGSQNIDLRKCIISSEEEVLIELNVVFGNCDIWVPADWNLQVNVEGVFSSIEDVRSEKPTESGSKKTLILTGICVFSSLDIKN